MKYSHYAGIACAIALAVTLGGAALADIAAFNAAVKAGNYKAAAVEAKGVWSSWNPSDPDTATVAREFGFASLVAGRNDLALEFGTFLVEKGATLANPDDQPLTSAVLYRVADFKIRKGTDQRSALRTALEARNGAPGVDMTSVLSWEALYVGDWDAGDWDNSIGDATAASEYFARNRSLLGRQRKAELHSVSSEFVKARARVTVGRNELYNMAADVHDSIVNDIDNAPNESARKEFWPIKWKAEAWAIAIESYVISSYQQVGSNINTSLKPRGLVQPRFAQYSEASPLPLCEGEFVGKRLIYPKSKAFQGVGSMIIHMETAKDGQVIKVDVLAAIPNEQFVSTLVETMQTWTYKPTSGVSRDSCRLDFRNHVYKGIFRLG